MHPNIPKQPFPPNVPQKLIEKFIKKNSNYSALARQLKINKAIVHNLLTKGIEPTNPDIRVKLFLPRKYRKPIPAWVKQGAAILRNLESRAHQPPKTYRRGGKPPVI